MTKEDTLNAKVQKAGPSDRELLELAAKAVGLPLEGYEWHDSPFYTGFMRRNFEPEGFELQTLDWNPLDDERDALRLAVDLMLDICVAPHAVYAGHDGGIRIHEEVIADAHAATRRTIVRAAAEIALSNATEDEPCSD